MKIFPVRFDNRNISNSNPNFEAKYAKLKQIKDLPCACCGKPVLDPARFFAAFKTAAKPLSYCLQKIDFSWIQNNIPKAYVLLQQFAQEQPKATVDTILEDNEKFGQVADAIKEYYLTPEALEEAKGDAYAMRKLRYKVREELTILQKRSRGILRGSSVVIKKFEPMKKYLQGRQKEVFEQFQIYAEKYPKLRLSEIVQLDEVYKFHKAKSVLQRAETNEKLNYHLGNIDKMVLKSSPNAEDKLYEVKGRVREIIANEFDDEARLPMIKELYSEALKELGCEKLKFKVFDELSEMPLTFITKDSNMVRFRDLNFSDNAIIDSIFAPYEASDEHNEAMSVGGADSIYNTTVMHRSCNLKRGSRPYSVFVGYHPFMPYHTQQQIDRTSKEILAGNLPDEFDYYPTRVADNLRNCSEGKIDINVDDYCKKQIKKTAAKAKEIIEEKLQVKSELGSIEEEIRKLQERAIALEEKNHELNRASKANKAVYKEIECYQGKK